MREKNKNSFLLNIHLKAFSYIGYVQIPVRNLGDLTSVKPVLLALNGYQFALFPSPSVIYSTHQPCEGGRRSVDILCLRMTVLFPQRKMSKSFTDRKNTGRSNLLSVPNSTYIRLLNKCGQQKQEVSHKTAGLSSLTSVNGEHRVV